MSSCRNYVLLPLSVGVELPVILWSFPATRKPSTPPALLPAFPGAGLLTALPFTHSLILNHLNSLCVFFW